jgi:opacity protein-like surface antigen
MKRALAVAMVVAAAATGASIAEAAIQHGTFAGKTSAGDPIGFKVDRQGRVVSFYYENVRLKCSDGDKYDTLSGKDRVQTQGNLHYRVGSKGKFSITVRNNSMGSSWDATGKFNSKGTASTGTLKVRARFNVQNEGDPKGSITCESAKLSWTATRH